VPAFELNGIGAVHGVTSVDNEVYVVRANSSNIDVYTSDTYVLQRRLAVKALIDAVDMTSCGRYRCLYVADCTGAVVHRVEISRLRDVVPTSWEVRDRPYGLSVTSLEGHVLVACRDANRLKQFTTLGQLVRDISLEPSVAGPRHAVQLSSGQFVVVHTGRPDVTDRVSIITSDGRHVTVSYSGYLLNYPTHVAVDRRHGFIYVPDYSNRRVVVLNRDLIQVGEVGGTLRGVWAPRCVWFDAECRRLYVAECGGRIIVYDISHHPVSRSQGSSSFRRSGFTAEDDNNSPVDL
jgi:DNA-binding beta-propeller fold protein YncE